MIRQSAAEEQGAIHDGLASSIFGTEYALTQPEARRWAPRDNYAFGEFLTARSLAPRERRAEATAEFIGTGGAGGSRRARHLPQCRDRLLRSPLQGTGTPRAGDHRRA